MLKLSVVIPCYNHGKYIHEAIQSVLAYPVHEDIEIIVINDGSTDTFTIEVLHQINHPSVKVVHQENQGLGKSRNNGIKLASADIIFVLDSDNRIDPRFIPESLQLFDIDKDLGVVYCDSIIFDDTKSIKRKIQKFDPRVLLMKNYIDACAFFRKSIWAELGGYDETMPYMGLEDWDFWIRNIGIKTKFYHLKRHYFYYRDTPNSMAKSTTDQKYQTLYAYILKKNAAIYAEYMGQIGYYLTYSNRKPLLFAVKKLLGRF